MSKLFNRDKSVISRHIKTAMNEELSNNSVVAKFATTASDVKEIIRVINDYSKALDLLDDYDHKTLKKAKGKTSDRIISYDDCMKVIGDLKFNESSDLFALERNEGLKAILGSIYQTFNGKDVYCSLEEKCANLLYMVVKKSCFY